MPLIKCKVSLTEAQAQYIQAKVTEGTYGSASEFIRDLVRERLEREAIKAKPGRNRFAA